MNSYSKPGSGDDDVEEHTKSFRAPEAKITIVNHRTMKTSKSSKTPIKHSIVQRGKVAARQLVEGIAIEEVATRCTLSQELVLQVLVKTIFEQQNQLAEQLAVVQRLYQILIDQLQNGVVYPTSMFQIDHVLFRRQPVDDSGPKKQRKPTRTDT